MKKIIYYICLFFTTLICLFGVSAFFIASNSISEMLYKGLKLKVNPALTGGEIAQDFTYSANEDTDDNCLVNYTVHQPVYQAVWQENPEYWQLDLEYKDSLSDDKAILINIDFDQDDKTSIEVWYNNNEGKVYNASKEFVCNTENYIRNEGKKIIIRIPLAKKELHHVYEAKKTYHKITTSTKV